MFEYKLFEIRFFLQQMTAYKINNLLHTKVLKREIKSLKTGVLSMYI